MEDNMAEEEHHEEQQEIPRGQKFMDNLFWLFILSVVISLVVYNAWGLIEILSVPAP
jgi:hypothetical protein